MSHEDLSGNLLRTESRNGSVNCEGKTSAATCYEKIPIE